MRIWQLSFREDITRLISKENLLNESTKPNCLSRCITTSHTSCSYTIQHSSFYQKVQVSQPFKRQWTQRKHPILGISWSWLRLRSWTQQTTLAMMISTMNFSAVFLKTYPVRLDLINKSHFRKLCQTLSYCIIISLNHLAFPKKSTTKKQNISSISFSSLAARHHGIVGINRTFLIAWLWNSSGCS